MNELLCEKVPRILALLAYLRRCRGLSKARGRGSIPVNAGTINFGARVAADSMTAEVVRLSEHFRAFW